jgi:hypothetical protein
MKLSTYIVLSLVPLFSFGQCKDCTSFQEAIKNPEIVETIKINPWIQAVELGEIPYEISAFTNLRKLFLPGHPFKVLPETLTQLKSLEELSFADCQLEKLPDFMFSLTQLKELILLDNNFDEEYKEYLKNKFKTEMPKTKVLL